jgi:signal peptidase I
MKWHSLRGILQVAIGVVIALIMMQTWLVLGWIVPMTVSGSSMAPALLGPHRWFRCEECAHDFAVGLDQLPLGDLAVCPRCGERRAVAKVELDESGQRLAVDRTAFAWREPRRWETVVFQCPENAGDRCVKRIVGLPGEAVTLDDGDVLVNGRIARKSLADQLAVRQLVYEIGDDLKNLTRFGYRHPGDGPITDELAYNQGATPPVNQVMDVMLTFEARLDGAGQLVISAANISGGCEMIADFSRRDVVIRLDKRTALQRRLPSAAIDGGRFVKWTFSLFDRQVLVAVGDDAVLAVPWNHDKLAGVATESPLVIDVRCSAGEIRRIAVWRDVYYAVRHNDGRQAGVERGAGVTWRLGPGKYFVLGDNAAISDDSRSWPSGPGIDAKLLIGKPLGGR